MGESLGVLSESSRPGRSSSESKSISSLLGFAFCAKDKLQVNTKNDLKIITKYCVFSLLDSVSTFEFADEILTNLNQAIYKTFARTVK